MIVFDSHVKQIHQLLLEYIKLHDKVFDTSTRFKKIIKTFFPIKFPKIKSELEAIERELDGKKQEIQKLDYDKDSIEETNLYESLIKFTNSLKTTINYFDVILIGLIKKSENQSYPIDDYKNDHNIYVASIPVYRKNGDDLNKIFSKYIHYSTQQYVKNNNT
jgi:hypothetical protein